jgi:hypothetical protein
VAYYQAALERAGEQLEWRLELAHLLQEEGRLADAHRELLVILGRQPENVKAQELLTTVARELAASP